MTVNKTSALGDSSAFLGSSEDMDPFGLACTTANIDAREVEPSGLRR